MFLDEKLYQHTMNRNLQDADDFKTMINELFKVCEDHFKPQLRSDMTYTEGTVMIDRVFNSWDLFIARLEKEEYFLIDILSKASYKSVFMNNPALVEIYNKGK